MQSHCRHTHVFGFGLPCVCFGLRAYNSRSRPKVEEFCLTKLVEVVSKLVGSSQKDIVRCVTKGNNLNHVGTAFCLTQIEMAR